MDTTNVGWFDLTEARYFMKKDIDIERLKMSVVTLKELLFSYSEQDSLARTCLNELEPIFNEIEAGKPKAPYDEIPCGRYFVDGALGNYTDLSEAYSIFANLAEGVDEVKLNSFFSSLE